MAKIVRDVIGIGHRSEVAGVAAITGCRRVHVTLRVAGNTLQCRMRSGEWERRRTVVKRRGLPGCRRVTLGAEMTEVVLHMIRTGHARKIARMTVVTGGQRVHIPLCMAGNTLESNVRTGQSKPG